MRPTEVIETITTEIRDEQAVRALFLSGSYGAGIEDQYSDIDFLAVATDGLDETVMAAWRKALSKIGDVVLWFHAKQNVISAVTEQWLRIDLEVVNPNHVLGRAKSRLKPLFDHGTIYDALRDEPEAVSPQPKLQWQIDNFIRVLGLMTVAIGREDYLNGVTGIFHLRNLLIDLLIEETGAPNRGGALHLDRLITDEQRTLLESLPAPLPTRDAVIDANLAYAKAYLPRARRMAERLGIDWPARFEAATWAHLKSKLAIERPADL